MKKFILLIYIFGLSLMKLASQNVEYFQQKVDYEINCKLNDKDHTLEAHFKILYHNNSKDALDRIGMHMWPNAFSNKKTAFAKQKLLHRSSKFYDSNESKSGNIKVLNLKVNGEKAEMQFVNKNPDMAWLILSQVLKPNATIEIEGDFNLKIPSSFSRLGHVDQSYQITQWYPKPAVYDKKGWHLFPYLDQGEFFGDFGNYKVTISIPENYIVAASGILMDSSELNFLERKIKETNQKLASKNGVVEDNKDSSVRFKTLHYVAENVHDFAWFADKTFLVRKGEAKFASGKKTETWAFFNDKKFWPDAAMYAAKALEFYSETLGEYPWPQVTVVHSALSAGGGMEYPMITVIADASSAKFLDDVICHEVGHNWLQGIIATNERDHAWMDEGINSYYEHRYMARNYKDLSLLKKYGGKYFKNLRINSETELLYQILAHLNLDQNINLTSNDFTYLNYGYDVYERSSELFLYLEEYIGIKEFDRLMKLYFETWKFKHPYPEDLQNIFRNNCKKNTDWFFNDILYSNKRVDYSITGIKKNQSSFTVNLKNKSKIIAPLRIGGFKKDSLLSNSWVDGFLGNKSIEIQGYDFDKFVIDPEGKYFDFNKTNNTIRTHGVFKKIEPVSIGIKNIYKSPDKSSIFIYPSILWNYYNGFMYGLTIGTPLVPKPKWNIRISPKYAQKSNTLAGIAEFSYRKNCTLSLINFLKLGITAKSFAYGYQPLTNNFLNYIQFKPFITLDFSTDRTKFITSKLSYEIFHVQDKIFEYSILDSGFHKKNVQNNIHKLKYYYSIPALLGP
ncbi:MAG: M1 family metallopeptidase, partial [Saprospiraceae bacterium]